MGTTKEGLDSKPLVDRAIVATLILPGSGAERAHDPLQEISGLVEAAGAQVVAGIAQRLPKINPRTAFGRGKVSEILQLAKANNATLIVIDHNLSPSQGRNLEEDLRMRVIDRTELILDIFATRAQTNQAKLQVELAQMEYMKTRLKRMWTHLERTEGAVGSRGPGETQLETDRRLVGAKVTSLKRKLKEIENRRQREAVAREYPYTISLVGYTNAGKSSMLQSLTDADVYIADQLFATLDTRVRYWTLQDGRKVVLADTVGFVRDLPHNLVASFHATLEETINADLLVHMCDASDPDITLNIEAVDDVLQQLRADSIPSLLILNKWDKVNEELALELKHKYPDAICLSVHDGFGINNFDATVAALIDDWSLHLEVEVPATEGKLLADFNKHSLIIREHYHDNNWIAHISLAPRHWSALRARLESCGGSFSASLER
ncbi:MAG: GTPase HflX [Planctomycetes bacterium]|nr:GTPase HflX [Planctomycetota bacterium]